MRPRRLTFQELVDQNKQELLRDQQAMTEIEKQMELKQQKKNEATKKIV
ncbi:FbpB family small basic protein [Aquibacillus sp. 3ASR75-11]|uniref:FbpB family small basic protein n=1 Tax=Terrihalobacillus insolitus TaxID=2950438 RepID=A0A9X4ALH4_9BACI|nr:FbpB family small basic protein [Terrihalobacillus insolitus]MDC3412749.1 FbpB family small basic protein [Terrihalobacillus insolitus]MDC3423774.1 FbpB family small basic protein [Terrihalobacillus insolitus]